MPFMQCHLFRPDRTRTAGWLQSVGSGWMQAVVEAQRDSTQYVRWWGAATLGDPGDASAGVPIEWNLMLHKLSEPTCHPLDLVQQVRNVALGGVVTMFVGGLIAATRERLVMLAEGAPLIDGARLFNETGTDIVVICAEDGRLAGVVTKTDVVRQISRCLGSACNTQVSSVMTHDVVVCRHGEQLSLVWSEMKARKLKNIPVIDDESRPVGVLNARDALQALLDESENEESLLRDYVMTVGYH